MQCTGSQSNEGREWKERRKVRSRPVVLKVMCRSTIVASPSLLLCWYSVLLVEKARSIKRDGSAGAEPKSVSFITSFFEEDLELDFLSFSC